MLTPNLVAIIKNRHRKKKRRLRGRKGGLFSSIEPDISVKPTQRVFYDREAGVIRVYVTFPGVSTYLGPGLEGLERPEGRVLLAELVGEAFCREVARKLVETGKYSSIPGAEIDNFNSVVNELQRKYFGIIHEITSKI